MSLRKIALLGSNLASITDLKRIETPHMILDLYNSLVEPMPVIWQSLRRLFQKVIEGLEGKINVAKLLGQLGVTFHVK